jgi:hypothetical protein
VRLPNVVFTSGYGRSNLHDGFRFAP